MRDMTAEDVWIAYQVEKALSHKLGETLGGNMLADDPRLRVYTDSRSRLAGLHAMLSAMTGEAPSE